MTRKWHVDQALHSYRTLVKILLELTEGELLKALEVESQTRRRKAIMSRLRGRLRALARGT